MSAVIDYILETNLFNFIIFVAIITYIIVKLDIVSGLDKAKDEVVANIEVSEAAKIESEKKLSSIEDSVSHLSEEIEAIISKSSENAEIVGAQILNDAAKTANNIKENAAKNIENRAALLKNDIMKRASLASVEVAREQILRELAANQDLHNKLIDESIEAISGVKL